MKEINMSLTTKEVVSTIAEVGGITKVKAKDVLDELLNLFANELSVGGEVVLKKFGRFYLKNRPARKGRNPRTGAEIDIAAKTVVKFAPRGILK